MKSPKVEIGTVIQDDRNTVAIQMKVEGAMPFTLAIEIEDISSDEGLPVFKDFSSRMAQVKIGGRTIYTDDPGVIRARDGQVSPWEDETDEQKQCAKERRKG